MTKSQKSKGKSASFSMPSKVTVDNCSEYLRLLGCRAARQSDTLLIIVEDSVLIAWKPILNGIVALHKEHGIKAKLVKTSKWSQYEKYCQKLGYNSSSQHGSITDV